MRLGRSSKPFGDRMTDSRHQDAPGDIFDSPTPNPSSEHESVTQRKLEPPCEKTGKSCEWVWEEWQDFNGDYNCDLYCFNCYRYRDFSLESWEDNDE